MSILHAYFNLRRQNDFQRCLEQSRASTSNSTGPQPSSGSGSGPGSRSWTKLPSFSTHMIDVNARDWLGRTVLHLAAIDANALEYIRLLLAHPLINVNLQDQESLWSPLHRALYAGNIAAAVLLLQRNDVDMFLKDAEGYTPFDLYNSTVPGTNPVDSPDGSPNAELYTWGSNRNASLGIGDGDDRLLPEQVVIKPSHNLLDAFSSDPRRLLDALKPISVVNVAMSKLHTTIITGEETRNLRSCGFSSSGRLGPGVGNASHTQFSLINPQETLPHKIITVALGQDHTLAVTSNGEALSWGLNRFHQLGYAFEGKISTQEDQIQAAARKITGPLRNQAVIGVACCKTASVCWTSSQIFSWGTNGGQLGYEKTGQPQIMPRLVSCVSEPVLGVAMTETAMLVLLKSRDVICLHDGNHWKLQFTVQRSLRAYRPPSKERTEIRKVIASENSLGTFAMVSEAGDVYLLNTEDPQAQRKETSKDGGPRRPVPHLVWGVRRQFTAVKDVALGSDGSMVLCTRSGHVFVRTRVLRGGVNLASGSLINPPKNSPIFKFHRVSNLQRITRVCANSTGAFAALRVDAIPKSIRLGGPTMAADLDRIQPFRSWARHSAAGNSTGFAEINDIIEQSNPLITAGDDDDAADVDVATDIQAAIELCDFLTTSNSTVDYEGPQQLRSLSVHHGADILFQIGEDHLIPAHKALLLARAPVLGKVLSGASLNCSDNSSEPHKVALSVAHRRRSGQSTIKVTGCSPVTILILCYYLYTDKVVTIWDRRVSLAISDRYGPLNIDALAVKAQLRILSSESCLQLHGLKDALSFVGKAPSNPTLNGDLDIFGGTRIEHDIIVHLADRQVMAHSFVLRSRSPFFSTFFNEECWTMNRFQVGKGIIDVDLKEFKFLPMSYLFRYLYEDKTQDLFSDLDFIQTSEQFVDFMFEVIACSNHLLLDNLTDICSANILRFVDLQNVSSVLMDAQHLNATALVKSLHGYMTENLETLMEMHALDELPSDVLKSFSLFLRDKQVDYHPHIRRGGNIRVLEKRWANWLQLQDFPAAFAPKYLVSNSRPNLTLVSHPMSSHDLRSAEALSASMSRQRTISKADPHHGDDDIFPMDGDVSVGKYPVSTAPASIFQPSSPTVPRGWKSPVLSDRADMRTIMEAEKQASDAKRQQNSGGSPSINAPLRAWMARPLKEQDPRNPRQDKAMGIAGGSPPLPNAIPTATPGASSSALRPSPSKRYPTTAPDTNSPTSKSLLVHRQTTGSNPSSPSDTRILSSTTNANPMGLSYNAKQSKENTMLSPSRRLGPLITPVKNAAGTNLPVRRTASGDSPVWSSNRSTVSTPQKVVHGLSFAAIQEQQSVKLTACGPPKSLREIQDEEQEAAFLTWFEEESARLRKQEEETMLASIAGVEPQIHDGGKKRAVHAKRGRGGRERGRGRGRGQGQGRSTSELST